MRMHPMHPYGHGPFHRGGGRFLDEEDRRPERFFRHHGGGEGRGGRGEGRGHGGRGHHGGRGFERPGLGFDGRGHGGPGFDGPGFDGRREGKRFFMRGEFKFALLELLGSGPMHGYQLIKAMEEKTGGLYTPSAGSIYPNLQLLEEMGLAGSSEVDGKKLYHITDEGRSHLRERAQNAPVRPEERWERRGMHRFGGELDKRDIRGLAMTWPEAVGLLAQAAREARENPDSEQAARLRGIVSKLQEELKQVLASDSASGEDSAHEGDSRTDSEPLD